MPKPKSLVSQAAPATSTAVVPAAPVGGAIDVRGPAMQQTPYVIFASSKSPNWAKYVAAVPGLSEGDQLLIQPEPLPVVKLVPMRFMLLSARQFWTVLDGAGEVSEAFASADDADSKAQETIEAMVLVLHGARVIPARVSFRTTKCKAAHVAIKAREYAATPDWADQSDDHKATLAVSEPALRFVATVRTSLKTSRSSGYKYQLATSVISPVTAAEMGQLAEFFGSDAGREQLIAVREGYERRVADIAAKVKRAAA
jgi:hypothetical protein